MRKSKILALALTLALLVGIALAMALPAAAASAVTESDWLKAPSKTLKKCPGGNCDHTTCDYVYSFAVVGDTQNINIIDTGDSTKEYMKDLYTWIADRQDDYNIQYVLGLGDITQAYYTDYNDTKYGLGKNAIQPEWNNAAAAIAVLDNAKIPYSLVRGNHDVSSYFNNKFGTGTTYYNDLKALSETKDNEQRPMAGFFNESKIEDTYRKVIIGDHKYIIFTLDWFPTDIDDCTEGCVDTCEHSCLEWIDKILGENSDYTAIITTHDFIYRDGTIVDDYEDTFPYENLKGSRPNWEEVSKTGGNGTPKELWGVLRKHENVELILCGHIDEDNIITTQLRGDNGNTVTAMLIDPQTIDSTIEPVGIVAMFYVAADGKVMNVEYISTVRDNAGKAAYLREENQFELTLDYSTADDDGWTQTAHGDIPTHIYEAHPFHVLLDDDSDESTNAFLFGSYESWGEAHTAIRAFNEANSNVAMKKAKTFYVVMSKDVTDNYSGDRPYNEARLTLTKVVLDLNGKTLTLSGSSELLRFDTGHSGIFPRYGITNGNIKIAGSGSYLVRLMSGATSSGTLDLTDLNITYESASAKPLITYNAGSGSADVTINVTNCNIDSSKVTSAVTTLFDLKDTNNNNHVSLTLKGGSINGNTVANTTLFTENVANDKIKFVKDDNGNYTSVTMTDSGTLSGVFFSETKDESLEFAAGVESSGRYTYALTKSASVQTKYGLIPETYTDVDKYPFLLFKNGELKVATDNWQTLFNTELKKADLCSGSTVLLRKDIATGGDTWFLCHTDDVVIDLDGHTFTRSGKFMFHARGRDADVHNTQITVINGTIKTTKDINAIISFSNESTNSVTDNFDFIFDNVKFDISAGGSTAGVCLVDSFGDSYAGGASGSVTLNDCTIYRGAYAEKTVIFNLIDGSSKNKNDIKVTVNGGTLEADSLENLTIATFNAERESGKGSPDGLTFGNGSDGSEFTVKVPKSYDVSSVKFALDLKNNAKLLKTSEDSTTATYGLRSVTTPHGDLKVEYLDENAYPFVVFKNGEAIHAFSDWYKFIQEEVYKNEVYQSGCTLLLRKDYTTGTDSTNSPSYFHVIKDMTIDLGGHVFARGSMHMFQFVGYAATSYNVNITITNGTIKSGGSLAPICFNNNSKNTGVDYFNITCNGVTFDVSVNATGIVSCFKDGDKGSANTITLNNCKIARGSYANTQTLFALAETANAAGVPQNKIDVNIVINGGTFEATNLTGLTFATFSDVREGMTSSPDKITFGKGADEKAFTVKLPEDYAVPSALFAFLGDEYVFAKASADDTYDYYTIEADGAEDPDGSGSTPDSGNVDTEYGKIPADKADANQYPWVLFEGTSENGYTVVDYYSDMAVAYTKIVSALGKDYVLLLRANYTKTANKYVGNFTGSLTIDLGGHTLSIAEAGNYLLDLGVGVATGPKGTFNIKNGTVVKTGGRGIVCMNYDSKLKTNDAEYTFSFSNVTFSSTNSKYTANVIFTTWENAFDTATAKIVVNSTFEDCTFDYRNSISGAVMLNLAHTGSNKDRVQHNVVVKGGKILANTAADINTNFAILNDNANGRADSIKFEANANGEYVNLVLPKSVAESDVTSGWTVADGGICTFVKSSEKDSDSVYVLAVKTAYGNIPTNYANVNNHPIVIFKADGTFVGTYTSTSSALKAAGLVSGGTGSAVGGADCVILLRKDLSISNADNVTGYKNNVIIDLNGYTLTSSNACFMTLTNSASDSEDKTYGTITFKNGSICYTGGGTASSIIRANGAEGIYNIDFKNVTISTTNSTSTKALYLIISTSGSSKAAQVVNSVFTNCVFDYTEAQSKCYLFGSGNNLVGGVINATIIGGEIRAGANNSLVFIDTTTNRQGVAYLPGTTNDSIELAKGDDGSYVKLVLDKDASAPSTSLVWKNADGAECVFVKVSEDETTASYVMYPKVMLGYKIKTSVTLYSNLVYNVYVPKSTELLAVTVDGEEITLTDEMLVDIEGSFFYHITVSLPIAESVNNIALKVTLKSGTSSVDAKWTLNTVNYAKTVLNAGSDVEKTVVRDMLSYAKAAYTYFNGTGLVTDDKYNEAKNLIESVIGADYDANNAPVMAETAVNTTGAEITNATITLGKKLTFTFIVADGYDANDFVFTMGGAELETVVNGNTVTVSTYGYAVRNTVEYTVNGTDIKGSYNLKYYYDGADASVQALLRGLWKYSESAEAYKASVSK